VRLLIQRVSEARVRVNGQIAGEIGRGLLVFVGVGQDDVSLFEVDKWALKLSQLRIFSDSEGKMNRSVNDVQGGILLVSQFTLYASTKKGNRPSFIQAASPETALSHFNELVFHLEKILPGRIQTGVFGADMKVELLNDGPVTIWMDTHHME
jgi:D-tyrosyl-tRNA(Tyr) deacylase